jgi:hypothetical protein
MCNLYSITTNQAAIINLFRAVNRYVGNLQPMPVLAPKARLRLRSTGTASPQRLEEIAAKDHPGTACWYRRLSAAPSQPSEFRTL